MFRYALIVFLLCQITVGCAQREPATPSANTQAENKLEKQILQRLSTDPITSKLKFRIDLDDGVVTLMGRADSAEVRLRAISVVRSTPGVRAVIDKIYRY